MEHFKTYIIAGSEFTATLDSQQLASWEWKGKLAQGKDQPGGKRKTGCFSYFLSLFRYIFKARSLINVWQEKSPLVLPWKKTHSLGGLGMFAVQLVTLMPFSAVRVSPLTRLPPLGSEFYAYQVVPVVSLLSASQYLNSVTTVLSLACTGLLQSDFACKVSSFLGTEFVPLFVAWGFFLRQFLFQHPPRTGFYSPDTQGLSQSLFAIRMRYVQKVWIKLPQIVSDLQFNCDPEAGISYRGLLSFSPCTFLSVLLESKVSLRFCLLSFQSHSKHSLKAQLSLYPDKLVQTCPECPLHCLCQG